MELQRLDVDLNTYIVNQVLKSLPSALSDPTVDLAMPDAFGISPVPLSLAFVHSLTCPLVASRAIKGTFHMILFAVLLVLGLDRDVLHGFYGKVRFCCSQL
ncbi:hypothetical protein COCNU_03G000730 [Cocos nucifera]|uniref:Uncharacterized protein n=1 Tax=Cocos nucifera TaxID=13894 RepID=A0A8K0I1X8_COCNU|nr:hypothetical protein COCNU_03G000730 [Cocos nucifera]